MNARTVIVMIDLVLLACICFVQNMAFTWSGRSRASGDVQHHAMAALFSNGTWFLAQIFVWKSLWQSLTTGNHALLILTGVTYVVFTAAGSALMMQIMLRTETGKRRVGAR